LKKNINKSACQNSLNKAFSINICILKWIVKSICVPVKPLFTSGLWLFNDQVPGFFSKNVINLKDIHFIFHQKTFQLKEKSHLDFLMNGTIQKKAESTLSDNDLLNQFRKVEKLPDDKKRLVKEFLDAFLFKYNIQQQIAS